MLRGVAWHHAPALRVNHQRRYAPRKTVRREIHHQFHPIPTGMEHPVEVVRLDRIVFGRVFRHGIIVLHGVEALEVRAQSGEVKVVDDDVETDVGRHDQFGAVRREPRSHEALDVKDAFETGALFFVPVKIKDNLVGKEHFAEAVFKALFQGKVLHVIYKNQILFKKKSQEYEYEWTDIISYTKQWESHSPVYIPRVHIAIKGWRDQETISATVLDTLHPIAVSPQRLYPALEITYIPQCNVGVVWSWSKRSAV